MKHIKAKINKKVKRFKINKNSDVEWCSICRMWVQDLATHIAECH